MPFTNDFGDVAIEDAPASVLNEFGDEAVEDSSGAVTPPTFTPAPAPRAPRLFDPSMPSPEDEAAAMFAPPSGGLTQKYPTGPAVLSDPMADRGRYSGFSGLEKAITDVPLPSAQDIFKGSPQLGTPFGGPVGGLTEEQKRRQAGFAAAIGEQAKGLGAFMASPLGQATSIAGGPIAGAAGRIGGPLIRKLIGAGFTADIASQLPDQYEAWTIAQHSGTPEEQEAATVNLAAPLLMLAGMTTHLGSIPKPPPAPPGVQFVSDMLTKGDMEVAPGMEISSRGPIEAQVRPPGEINTVIEQARRAGLVRAAEAAKEPKGGELPNEEKVQEEAVKPPTINSVPIDTSLIVPPESQATITGSNVQKGTEMPAEAGVIPVPESKPIPAPEAPRVEQTSPTTPVVEPKAPVVPPIPDRLAKAGVQPSEYLGRLPDDSGDLVNVLNDTIAIKDSLTDAEAAAKIAEARARMEAPGPKPGELTEAELQEAERAAAQAEEPPARPEPPAKPPEAAPVVPTPPAVASPAPTEWNGKPLSHWEAIASQKKLGFDKTRKQLAKVLGVNNNSPAVLKALRAKVAELKGEAPPDAAAVKAAESAKLLKRMKDRLERDEDRIWDDLDELQGEKASLKSVRENYPGFVPYGKLKGILVGGDKNARPIDELRRTPGTEDMSVGEYLDHLNSVARAREEARKQKRGENKALDEQQKHSDAWTAAKEPSDTKTIWTPTDATRQGDKFTIDGKEVRVKRVFRDEEGYPEEVEVDGGSAFGDQTIKAGDRLQIDKDSYKGAPLKEGEGNTDFLPPEEKPAAPAAAKPPTLSKVEEKKLWAERNQLRDEIAARGEAGPTAAQASRMAEIERQLGQGEMGLEIDRGATEKRVQVIKDKIRELERLAALASRKAMSADTRAQRNQALADRDAYMKQIEAEEAKVRDLEDTMNGKGPAAEGGGQDDLIGMGGAVPGEYEGSGTATSIKNATVDAERAKRGLPPAMEPARRTWGEVWDHAMALIDRKPETQDLLIAELKKNPRALTDLEDALLLHRQIDLQNRYARATRDLSNAYDDAKAFPNRLADVEAGKAAVQAASDALLELYDVNKSAGTETGRGLNARKMLAEEDYTLAQMEVEARASVDGRPLTDAERAEIAALHEKIKVTQEAFDTYQKQVELERAGRMTDEAIKEMQAELARRPAYDSRILQYAEKVVGALEKEADSAASRLKARLGRTSAGVDPTILYDVGVILTAKIARKSLDLARATAEMVAEYGEGVRAYIEPAWKKANEKLNNVNEDYGKLPPEVKAKVKAKADKDAAKPPPVEASKKKLKEIDTEEASPSEIAREIQKLARAFVEEGTIERDALVDRVHSFVTDEMGLDWDRRTVMDAISGYGDFKPLSQDAVSTILRDIKQQLQQVAKLEDITDGKPILKSGVERQAPNDETRRLIQQVNEAKRRYGVVVSDPASQLKSALGAIKKRLENQISDLEYQIANRERIVPTRTPAPFDDTTTALEQRRDALKAQLDELVPKPGLTPEQLVARAERGLERNITEIERQIAAGELAPKRTKAGPTSPRLEALRARRDAVRAELDELRANAPEARAAALEARKTALEKTIAEKRALLARGAPKPAPGVPRPTTPEIDLLTEESAALSKQIAAARRGPPMSPEERALRALKARLTASAANYSERAANGDFAPRPKRVVKLDAEAINLKTEADAAKEEYHRKLLINKLKNRSALEKTWSGVKASINVPRNVLSSWDVSAVLRQGGFIGIGNPRRAARNIIPMLRALRSEKAADRIETEILNRPNAALYKQGKLYIAPRRSLHLTALEEEMANPWADKIPGVRASNRAYITFLNKLRADSFDAMIESVSKKGGELTPQELQAIGNYINVATGRGNMGRMANASETLATVFFSPRLMASRFQLLAGQPMYKGSLRTRGAIAREYGKFLGGMAVIYGLGMLAGGKIETDRRSSDFGKIRFGNTRLDLLGGLSQVTVLARRVTGGETKDAKGRIKKIRGDVPFGQTTTTDVMKNFLRSKLSPVVGTGVDLAQGRNVVGEKVTPGSAAANLVTPLSFRDIYEAMKDQGVPEGTALGILSLFGASLQTYDPKSKRQ